MSATFDASVVGRAQWGSAGDALRVPDGTQATRAALDTLAGTTADLRTEPVSTWAKSGERYLDRQPQPFADPLVTPKLPRHARTRSRVVHRSVEAESTYWVWR